MEYRRLGRSGLQLSALSFGAWVTFGAQLGETEAGRCLAYAWEQGVNFFDNAEVYDAGNAEVIMGKVLKRKGWPRERLVISSKVYWGGDGPNMTGLSRKRIFSACHNSLKRLQVDYLDLYFCHRPDPHTPIEETVWAMNDLIRQGKILYWGTSEWSAAEIMAAVACARSLHLVAPTMEQPQYNMFNRQKMEAEFLPLFREIGLGTTTWSPLDSGVLTGKYNRGLPRGNCRATLGGYECLRYKFEGTEAARRFAIVEKLMVLATKLEMSSAQLAIAFCLRNPRVSSVILGASRVEQLKENLLAIKLYSRLTAEVVADIETILQNQPLIPTVED